MSSAFGDVIVYSLGSAPDTVEGTKGTGRWAVPARQTRTRTHVSSVRDHGHVVGRVHHRAGRDRRAGPRPGARGARHPAPALRRHEHRRVAPAEPGKVTVMGRLIVSVHTTLDGVM